MRLNGGASIAQTAGGPRGEPNKVDDGTKNQRKAYGPGTGGAEVILWTIEGGGHTWPGMKAPVNFFGKSTQNISANDLMWEFFEKHPRK